MRASVVGWGVVILVAVARPSSAQGAGDVGLTFAYPGSVGVVWHITDGIAVRPDFSAVKSETESTTTSTISFPGLPTSVSSSVTVSDGWNATTGVTLLLTLRRIDQLRLYLAPRAAYLRSTSQTSGGTGLTAASFESKSTGWLAAGALGAEFRAHDHFAVFAELGAQYVTQSSTSAFSTSRSVNDITQVGLRSAVGATWYF